MTELAKKITIDRTNHKVYINGQQFPWYISEDGPSVDGADNRNEIPRVTITILTEDLEIIPAGEPSVPSEVLQRSRRDKAWRTEMTTPVEQ